MLKTFLKRVLRYFLQGVLLLFPALVTVFLVIYVIKAVDDTFGLSIPGLGLVLAFASITVLGFLFSNIIGRTVFSFMDDIMARAPLINLIYSSLKDLVEAFVGEKKKFKKPVLVELYPDGGSILGFVTRKDLSVLSLPGKVAVYMPFSYSFTGRVIIVSADKVTPLDANATEVMKFIVSGGVTGLRD